MTANNDRIAAAFAAAAAQGRSALVPYIAAGDPQPMVELAGPREERLDDMVRRYARAHGARGWIPSVSLPTKQMKGMRAGLNLPGAGALIGTQTFDEWLAADAAS